MAYNIKLIGKNKEVLEEFKVKSPYHPNLVEKDLEEIICAESLNKKQVGTAFGINLLHCFFLASSSGWDKIFLDSVKYFKYSESDNKDYPITVNFYA